jgi:prevent-host-death family protein
MNTATASLGIETSRRRLPELASAAHNGQTTVITKHGKPFAALVPLAQLQSNRKLPRAWIALRGAGKGVWGSKPAGAVDALRREWD